MTGRCRKRSFANFRSFASLTGTRMQVRFYATLRAATGGGRVDLERAYDTVGDALDALVERFPDLGPLVMTAPRTLRPMIAVMVDGRDIRHLAGLDSTLAGATTLDIFPPVAGGAEITRRLAIRGLPEWLIRDYLVQLGARAVDDAPDGAAGTSRVVADRWGVVWTQAPVRISGSVMTLTEFTLDLSGECQAVERVEAAFLLKVQRGGG